MALRPSSAPEQSGGATPRRALPVVAVGAVVAAWITLVSFAISRGAFEWRLDITGDLPPGIALAIVAPVLVAVGLYRYVPAVRTWALSLDGATVLSLQNARLIGLVFIFAWAFGELPAGFAWPAAIGDISTGVAAFLAVYLLGRRRLTQRGVWGLTILGLGDFALAIVLAIVLETTALDVWPLAFFPGIAVPAFAILHLLTIAHLRNGRLPLS